MGEARLLLCTDMDGTVIPDGNAPEDAAARPRFAALCARPEVQLVYVTGRSLDLVQAALREYQLPLPAFAITDVGTRLYAYDGGAWSAWEAWDTHIDVDWPTSPRPVLEAAQRTLAPQVQWQEAAKQNLHKHSFYLEPGADHQALVATLRAALAMPAQWIVSHDPYTGRGLLDVLPPRASKYQALRFLIDELCYTDAEVVFAGDSGNDLDVLQSTIPAVLVANARPQVRDALRAACAEQGTSDRVHLARGWQGMNGNYAAGVLEGVAHFHPEQELPDG
jgi:sucrose-6-phosphatase